MTYWEGIALETRWGRYITSWEQRFVERALSRLGAGNALDIGCEGGRWTELLANRGWSVTAIDVDPDAVRHCAARIPSATCVAVDPSSTSLPCGDNSLDLVLCIEVREVMQSDWFAEEAARVLRPGGELVGVAWNRSSLRGLATSAWTRLRHGRPHPFYNDSYTAWNDRLRRAGFERLEARGLCWFPFGRASNSRLIPMAVAVEDRSGLNRLVSRSPWVVFCARRW
jgi:SAM-dependent methyltransferase